MIDPLERWREFGEKPDFAGLLTFSGMPYTQDAAELVAAAGSDGVRLLADTYHMNIEEDDICAALPSVADVLGAVHLSDSNRGQPGTGHVPFPAVLGTLAALGFDGVVSVECRLRGEPREAVASCGRYLRGLVDAAAA